MCLEASWGIDIQLYFEHLCPKIRSVIRQSTCYIFPFKSVERRCLLYPVIQKTLSIPSLSILIPFSVDNGVALSVNVGSSVGIILPSTPPPISCLNSTDKVSGENGREEGKWQGFSEHLTMLFSSDKSVERYQDVLESSCKQRNWVNEETARTWGKGLLLILCR